ncbi:hypothetical protein NE237_002698 [Protea cynaroides]|uniref:Uncharacterized protein n=1 Tax=Protea cynaroides TaxID=273540 RepID=A0A9Q0QS17_9MAGN|nr:hypothetical protein NE237_002698 [Protea cynaroides]
MKCVAVLLVLMMVSSCMAIQRKEFFEKAVGEDGDKEGSTDGNHGSRINNHHGIPRQDFNNWTGSSGDNSGINGVMASVEGGESLSDCGKACMPICMRVDGTTLGVCEKSCEEACTTVGGDAKAVRKRFGALVN